MPPIIEATDLLHPDRKAEAQRGESEGNNRPLPGVAICDANRLQKKPLSKSPKENTSLQTRTEHGEYFNISSVTINWILNPPGGRQEPRVQRKETQIDLRKA